MRLTHHPAMLHDNNVGIEWSWWKVSWRRGKRPLKVTHWAGSSARIPIHCDLSLRETKQYPIKLHTKLSDCYPKERVMQDCHPRNNYQLSGTQPEGICIHWNTKLIKKGAECVPQIPCTSPLLSVCVLSVTHAVRGRWRKDHGQGNEDGTNKVCRCLTAI